MTIEVPEASGTGALGPIFWLACDLVGRLLVETTIGHVLLIALVVLIVVLKLRSASNEGHLGSTLLWLSLFAIYSVGMVMICIPGARPWSQKS